MAETKPTNEQIVTLLDGVLQQLSELKTELAKLTNAT